MRKLTEQQKTLARKWVAALRSQEYDQGTHKLCTVRNGKASYCCLGVGAEVVHGEEAWENVGDDFLLCCDSTIELDDETMRALGITRQIAIDLANGNDKRGWDFPFIANYLEDKLGLNA